MTEKDVKIQVKSLKYGNAEGPDWLSWVLKKVYNWIDDHVA